MTVTGVNDQVADGPATYVINTAPATSSDTRFDGYDADDVQLVNYDNDLSTFDAVEPRGSLIYDSSLEGRIGVSDFVESYEVTIDRGQTITVLVEGSPDLQPTVHLSLFNAFGGHHGGDDHDSYRLVASETATSMGEDALIETVAVFGRINGILEPRKYRIDVGGASGTTGDYRVKVILNAALEIESVDGTPEQ